MGIRPNFCHKKKCWGKGKGKKESDRPEQRFLLLTEAIALKLGLIKAA